MKFNYSESELRPIETQNLELVLNWRNSVHIRTCMFDSRIISWNEHVTWFDKLKYRMDQKVLLYFYHGTPYGVVNLTKIDKSSKQCEWGFYIGDLEAPKGSGTAMGILGLDYVFDQMNLAKVMGQCFSFNKASSAYHEKLGFVQKNLDMFCKEAIANDVKLYELTSSVWQERRMMLFPHVFK